MNYLELCKRVRSECGISGDGPVTVVGQTRELGRLVSWVQQSWIEIQEYMPDWEWMRKSFTFNTTASKQSYAPVADILLTDFGSWRNNSFRSYLQSAGVGSEIILGQYETYSDFRDYHLLGSRKLVEARPIEIAIAPDKSLVLGPIPDSVYVISGEYYKTPQVLAADADIPDFPARFHMMIVYKAMEKYGLFESAQEQVIAGKAGYDMLLNKLLDDQMPTITQSGSFI